MYLSFCFFSLLSETRQPFPKLCSPGKVIEMEGRYNLYSQDRNGWSAFRDHDEFQEEDIWAVYEKNNSNSKIGSFYSSTNTPRRVPTSARTILRDNLNLPQEPTLIQQSLPINIPDWSKIYGLNSQKSLKTGSFHSDNGISNSWGSDEDNDDEDLDGKMMPPHEWIAKKLARTQISSFSVFEGAGRTLKGRDLSRVRNSVLTRTGFLE